DRETDQREANGRAGQHLETEGPAKWIHGCLLPRSRAALSLLRAVARTSAGPVGRPSLAFFTRPADSVSIRHCTTGEALAAAIAKPAALGLHSDGTESRNPGGAGVSHVAQLASRIIRQPPADGRSARRRPSAHCRPRGSRT